jgi:hypothetical protein
VLPGGLGAQESAIVTAGMMVGIAPDPALAVALIERAREVAYGISGLIAWLVIDLAGAEPEEDQGSSEGSQTLETCGPSATTPPARS